MVPLLDELSEDAADLGAVNTVVFRDGRSLGRNTDWSGYGRAFRQVLPDAVEDRVVLVGAGGAGVGGRLRPAGAGRRARLRCWTPTGTAPTPAWYGWPSASATTGSASRTTSSGPSRDAQGLVNATPVGMLGHPGMSVPGRLVRADLWVSDVVYFPLETELVALARARGCRVVPGGGMAVHQAVGAFEYFTGRAADAAPDDAGTSRS